MKRFCGGTALAVSMLLLGCVTRPPPVAISHPAVGYGQEYSGPEHRYRLRLPMSWQPARFAIHERSANEVRQLHALARDWVALDYIPSDHKQPNALLAGIVCFRVADWVELPRPQREHFPDIVAQTPEYIFIATLAAPSPYPPASNDAKAFASMRLDLEQIKRAFLFPDGRSAADSAHLATSGTYEAVVPGPSGTHWRKVSVILRPDGSALVDEEGGTPNLELAQWSQTEDVVLLQPLNRTGKSTGMPLLWTVQPQRLYPLAWDRSRYGSLGLVLRKKEFNGKPVGLSKN